MNITRIPRPIFFNMLLWALLFFVATPASFSQKAKAGPQIGMLILGSDNLQTLSERIEVALKLVATGMEFDYIIVTGGCGAHNSSICEASEMASVLQQNGVPAEIIYKEEKAKTTVQNYCYARILKKKDGTKVINPDDTLYVVSNHWHAMSVAARFSEFDEVNAKYYIEGNIKPATKDKVDYSKIFNHDLKGEDYCNSALWPIIGASFSLRTRRHSAQPFFGFVGALAFKGTLEPELMKPLVSYGELTEFPTEWTDGFDAAYYNNRENKVYVFNGSEYFSFRPESKRNKTEGPAAISDLFQDLPKPFNFGSFEAAFLNPENGNLYLFKADSYVQVSPKNGKLQKGPKKITDLVSNWPFGWGTGDIDAAHYDHVEEKLMLFRGKEFLKISLGAFPKVEEGFPKALKLEKPNNR